MNDRKQPEMMDPSMPEGEAVPRPNHPRNTYAMDQLIKEVAELFDVDAPEVSNRNQRNIAFDVQWTLPEERVVPDLRDLLALVEDDFRISEVIIDSEGVLVSFYNSIRIMDDTSSFGLAGAWEILTEGDS